MKELFNFVFRSICWNEWKFNHTFVVLFFLPDDFWFLSLSASKSNTLVDATSTFSLAFNPKTRWVTTQQTFPCWIQINSHCVCAQTTSCVQTCGLLMGAGEAKEKKKKQKKKLFLLLTSNPILPHPHPPLTQHGAAIGGGGGGGGCRVQCV